ncbi:methionyl-tRNA formyltransferase [Shigella flexneri]|uniref:methionyl-tRNA formyltransferase n=1 Tax=Shigella flexneri TaxID=623 RepID=UPI00374D2C5B
MSELSPYKQIIPAIDWYFRHDNVSGVTGKSTLYQLAAWALKENGEVVGLVTVRDDNGRSKLVTPPPVPGDYLHKEQLTDDEKEWEKRR